MTPPSFSAARDLLVSLGAPPRLLRHIELVREAADLLLIKLAALRVPVRADFVLVGVALHDSQGKRFGVTCSVGKPATTYPLSAVLDAAHRGAVDGIPGQVIEASSDATSAYAAVSTASGIFVVRTYGLPNYDTFSLMFGPVQNVDEYPAREFLASIESR